MRLTAEHVSQFHREGYLLVEDVLSDADLQPVIDEIAHHLDQQAAELVTAGELSQAYAAESFETRLIPITAETGKVYQSMNAGKLAGPGVFSLLTNPRLLDLIEPLVGPEIIAASAYRIRPKVPGYAAVPWHQDSAFFDQFCDAALILTAWIPLVDATPERGCMQVMRRVHQGAVVPHHYTAYHIPGRAEATTLEIVPEQLPGGEIITVPVRKGGVLLFTNRTPHRSIDNISDVVRWSIDLRFQSASLPTNYRLPDGQPLHEQHDDEPFACYPPEADLLVRSRAQADVVVHDWRQFEQIRRGYVPAPAPRRWD